MGDADQGDGSPIPRYREEVGLVFTVETSRWDVYEW